MDLKGDMFGAQVREELTDIHNRYRLRDACARVLSSEANWVPTMQHERLIEAVVEEMLAIVKDTTFTDGDDAEVPGTDSNMRGVLEWHAARVYDTMSTTLSADSRAAQVADELEFPLHLTREMLGFATLPEHEELPELFPSSVDVPRQIVQTGKAYNEVGVELVAKVVPRSLKRRGPK